MRRTRIVGSVLGLALGDAFGAPHEGGPMERALWLVLGRWDGRCRWTDDTQMTIDTIQSLLACGGIDQNDLAGRYARSYRWDRGYGPGAARVLKRIRHGDPWETASRAIYPGGSYGNGGAMRAPAVGLFHAAGSDAEIVRAARACAEVTHAHPAGGEGAALIALATALALHDTGTAVLLERLRRHARTEGFLRRLDTAAAWLQAGEAVAPARVAAELGNGVAAVGSCVTAIYTALRFRAAAFDELLAFVIGLKGDVDTIAAMAGAIWGAANGRNALPRERLARLEQAEVLEALAGALADAAGDRGSAASA